MAAVIMQSVVVLCIFAAAMVVAQDAFSEQLKTQLEYVLKNKPVTGLTICGVQVPKIEFDSLALTNDKKTAKLKLKYRFTDMGAVFFPGDVKFTLKSGVFEIASTTFELPADAKTKEPCNRQQFSATEAGHILTMLKKNANTDARVVELEQSVKGKQLQGLTICKRTVTSASVYQIAPSSDKKTVILSIHYRFGESNSDLEARMALEKKGDTYAGATIMVGNKQEIVELVSKDESICTKEKPFSEPEPDVIVAVVKAYANKK